MLIGTRLRPPLGGGEQIAAGVVGVIRALRGAARIQAGDQAVVGIIIVVDGVVLRACHSHAGAVSSRVKGIIHRQAALLAFAGQTPQAVVFISRDHAVLVGLACLIAGGIIGVVEGRKRVPVLRVRQARDPVGGVVGVGGGDAVGQRHARAVAVCVVGIAGLGDAVFGDGGEAVEGIVGIAHALDRFAVLAQLKIRAISGKVVGVSK